MRTACALALLLLVPWLRRALHRAVYRGTSLWKELWR
jgi:hypothetical protein